MTEQHRAAFSNGEAYFTWATGWPRVDYLSAAGRLLRPEIAETFSFPTSDEVLIARSYRAKDRMRKRLNSLQGLAGMADDEGSIAVPLTWMARNPRIAWGILKGKLSTNRSEPDEPGDESMADFQALLRDRVREVDEDIAHLQLQTAITHWWERRLFSPAYRERVPYVRMQLQPSRVRLGAEAETEFWIEPMLTLHASGVLTFTICMPIPADTDVAALNEKWVRADLRSVERIAITPELAKAAGVDGATTDDGWIAIEASDEDAEPLELTAVWRIYLAALDGAGIEMSPEWTCYPSLFLDASPCCSEAETWKANHTPELGALLAKVDNPSDFREGGEPAQDMSYSKDSALWHTSSFTVSMRWNRPAGTFRMLGDCVSTLLVVETFLVQYVALRAISAGMPELLGQGISGIRKLQVSLIATLEEFDHPAFSYRSAEAAVRQMLEEANAEHTYQRLRDRIGDLGNLAATIRAERRNKQAVTLAAFGIVLALLLGLPTIASGFATLRSIPKDSPWGLGSLVAPIRSASLSNSELALWTVLTLVGGTACWWLALKTWRKLKSASKPRRRLPAHSWSQGTIPIVAVDRHEAESAAMDDSGNVRRPKD